MRLPPTWWLLSCAALILDPSAACTPESGPLFGIAEVSAMIEGTWVVEGSGGQRVELRLEIATRPATSAADTTSWIRSAHACSDRTLVRSAAACLDRADVPLDIWIADRKLPTGGWLHADGGGMEIVYGLLELDLPLGRLTADLRPGVERHSASLSRARAKMYRLTLSPPRTGTDSSRSPLLPSPGT